MVTVYNEKKKLSFSSVQFSHSVVSDSLRPHELPGPPVHHQLLEPTQTHVHWVSWCHPTISSSVVPFSSCPQSSPASGSFQMSQFFSSGDQNIGVSASASVLPMNIQDWFPLGLTGWISLQSKGLSRVFSNSDYKLLIKKFRLILKNIGKITRPFRYDLNQMSLVTPWTVAHQAPLSMGFPRQEYWSGLPFSSPRDLSDLGIFLT